MGYLFLTIYVCRYIHTVRTYVRTGICHAQECDRNVAGFLPAIEFYLLRGLDGARTTTLRNRSVDECAVLQGSQSWSSYIWSQTVDICFIPQLHNNLA